MICSGREIWEEKGKIRKRFYFCFVCCLDEASCTGFYWWLGDARSCIQVVSFMFSLVQSLSCVWLFLCVCVCLTLFDPMNCSTPGLPIHHQLLEFTQTHVHWVGDAIQPSHPLSSPSPPALSLSQHQGLFKWVSSSHQVAKVLGVSASASVLPMNIQDWFPLGWGNSQGIRKKGKNELHKSHLRSTKLELGEAAVMWFLEKTPRTILTTPFVLEEPLV